MAETFREILDLFEDRDTLVAHWNRKVPEGRSITNEMVALWRHRNGIPSWSWAGLEAAARELRIKGVTVAKLVTADHASRLQRASEREHRAAS